MKIIVLPNILFLKYEKNDCDLLLHVLVNYLDNLDGDKLFKGYLVKISKTFDCSNFDAK